jgi:UDP:flavonoid glycosyltransferase YjiC (YdhE family)
VGPELSLEELRAIATPQLSLTTAAEQAGHFIRSIQPHVLPMFEELKHICANADLLVGPPFHLASRMVRDSSGTPWASLHFSPFGAYGSKDVQRATATTVNQCRAMAGLPPIGDPLGAESPSPDLALYAVSSLLIRRPAAWPSHHHVVGFYFLDEPDWPPNPDLIDFLQSGAPPILIDFGSAMHCDPDAVTRLLVDAVEAAGCRAILQQGWSGLGRIALPECLQSIGFAPHSWLLPRVACVVHHGGAGTTAATLRAGVPSIVIPHLGDQPMWAQYASGFGCAHPPIPYRSLTSKRLAAAIRRVLAQPSFGTAAKSVGARLRAEDGVGRSCELLEALVASRFAAV